MSSVLTIYKHFFKNVEWSRGVVAGPHKVFTETEAEYYNNTKVCTCKLYQHLEWNMMKYTMKVKHQVSEMSCHVKSEESHSSLYNILIQKL